MLARPFRIQTDQDALDDLSYRLEHFRWPNQIMNSNWDRGTDIDYLQSLVSYWRNHFDWRKQESELNCLAQFQCEVDGIEVHLCMNEEKAQILYQLYLPMDGRTVLYGIRK